MKTVKGHLEVMYNFLGFLRSIENNFKPDIDNTYVSAGMINKLRLREGSFIEGFADKKIPGKKNLALTSIEKINNLSMEEFSNVRLLQEQTRSLRLSDFTKKPGTRMSPMTLGGSRRNIQDLGCLLDSQPRKKMKFYQLSFDWILFG